MDGGDLQRGQAVQGRQDGRKALGQHGLTGARRPEQGEVMTTRGTDFGGTPGGRLPQHVGKIGALADRSRPAGRR